MKTELHDKEATDESAGSGSEAVDALSSSSSLSSINDLIYQSPLQEDFDPLQGLASYLKKTRVV